MNYYKIAKKAIIFLRSKTLFITSFEEFANITEEDFQEFDDFMYEKYGRLCVLEDLEDYINKCHKEYILTKIK